MFVCIANKLQCRQNYSLYFFVAIFLCLLFEKKSIYTKCTFFSLSTGAFCSLVTVTIKMKRNENAHCCLFSFTHTSLTVENEQTRNVYLNWLNEFLILSWFNREKTNHKKVIPQYRHAYWPLSKWCWWGKHTVETNRKATSSKKLKKNISNNKHTWNG